MVARFLYRLVSLLFLAMALLCWALTAVALVAQYKASGFDFQAFCAAIVMPIMAFMAHQCSNEAWRTARTYYRNPLWRDYP